MTGAYVTPPCHWTRGRLGKGTGAFYRILHSEKPPVSAPEASLGMNTEHKA